MSDCISQYYFKAVYQSYFLSKRSRINYSDEETNFYEEMYTFCLIFFRP
jgi:hypothetical protein